MKKHLQPLTPTALYARVNCYSVASEYVDEAEFRKMIEEGRDAELEFRYRCVGELAV